ncbi:hypothetical protein DPMN_006770 [Dreissena polymorpha]|uniref:Uncharacterized protein n=1 Tax=Dreissena polymorpha TaxID=45954 RepID=A0A9D4RXP7_DREPO|nr:hypothetical protein DPMN_006770 [Dreissena polymorpha]
MPHLPWYSCGGLQFQTAQLLLKVLQHSGWFDRCGDITGSESTSKGNSPSSMTG